MIERSLAESSRRVYANTYRQWSAYTERDGLDSLDLSFENISALVLNQSEVAYATRQSWKTHMLRLLDWLEEADTNAEWYGTFTAAARAQVRQSEADGCRARPTAQPKSAEPNGSRATAGCLGGRSASGGHTEPRDCCAC